MGVNGAGKSTLLRLIAGEAAPDAGTVALGGSVKLGYFAQHTMDLLDPARTVIETLEIAHPHASFGSLRTLAGAFDFSGDDVEKGVRVLSGGERARLVLATMLFEPPNFLVLDEPTNHLDLATKDMLTRALSDFDGTMIFVSHDRSRAPRPLEPCARDRRRRRPAPVRGRLRRVRHGHRLRSPRHPLSRLLTRPICVVAQLSPQRVSTRLPCPRRGCGVAPLRVRARSFAPARAVRRRPRPSLPLRRSLVSNSGRRRTRGTAAPRAGRRAAIRSRGVRCRTHGSYRHGCRADDAPRRPRCGCRAGCRRRASGSGW